MPSFEAPRHESPSELPNLHIHCHLFSSLSLHECPSPRSPRFVHSACLARWQLQKAGNREERCCRFCQAALPDWKRVLTPSCGSNAPAYMNVNFNGETFSFEVKPGSDGYSEFTK